MLNQCVKRRTFVSLCSPYRGLSHSLSPLIYLLAHSLSHFSHFESASILKLPRTRRSRSKLRLFRATCSLQRVMQAQATAPDQIIAKSGSEHLVRGSNAREIQQGERIAFARSSSGKSSPVIERKKKEAKTKTVSPKTSEGIIEERDKDAALDTDDTIWPHLKGHPIIDHRDA